MELRPPRKRHLLPCIPCLPWSNPPPNPNPSIRAHLCSSVVKPTRPSNHKYHRGSDGTSPSPRTNTLLFRVIRVFRGSIHHIKSVPICVHPWFPNANLETQERRGSDGTSPSPKKHHLLPCIPCLSWFNPPPNPNPSICVHPWFPTAPQTTKIPRLRWNFALPHEARPPQKNTRTHSVCSVSSIHHHILPTEHRTPNTEHRTPRSASRQRPQCVPQNRVTGLNRVPFGDRLPPTQPHLTSQTQ